MKKEKVYISGKISGLPIEEARARFAESEAYLRGLGYRTCNPLKMRLCVWLASHCGKRGYRLCLLLQIVWMMLTCDIIYMQRGWEESYGAMLERAAARAFGIYIIFEKEMKK